MYATARAHPNLLVAGLYALLQLLRTHILFTSSRHSYSTTYLFVLVLYILLHLLLLHIHSMSSEQSCQNVFVIAAITTAVQGLKSMSGMALSIHTCWVCLAVCCCCPCHCHCSMPVLLHSLKATAVHLALIMILSALALSSHRCKRPLVVQLYCQCCTVAIHS